MAVDPVALAGTAGPFPDAAAAARAAMAVLQDRLGFGLWALTRLEGGRHRLLVARDDRYGVREGSYYRWLDAYCRLLPVGAGPALVLHLRDAPAFAAVATPRRAPVRALLGAALLGPGGAPLGALLALDPLPQPAELAADLPLVALAARLLNTLLLGEAPAAG